MKVLSFGEILWDVYPDEKHIGGAPLNFAAHLARHGGEVFMLSSVGCDSLGEETLNTVKEYGVRIDYVKRVDKETGRCVVTLDSKGVPSYDLKTDVAWDHIDGIEGVELDALYYGTLSLRSEHNRRTLQALLENNRFGEVFCDVNIRAPFYSADALVLALENATLVKISDEELPVVMRLIGVDKDGIVDSALAIEERFKRVKAVIITRGEKGAFAHIRDGVSLEVPAVQCKVVSTVGAGDSFSAAFLWKYMSGCDARDCLEHASYIASVTVSHYGAMPEYEIN